MGVNWTKTGHLICCMIFETSPAAISHRHSPFVRPTAPSFVGYYHKPYSGLSKPSMNGLPCLQFYVVPRESALDRELLVRGYFFIPLFASHFWAGARASLSVYRVKHSPGSLYRTPEVLITPNSLVYGLQSSKSPPLVLFKFIRI